MRPIDTSVTDVLSFADDAALRRRFMVIDEPMRGNLRFGLTLELLDKLAEETALAYVRRFDGNARVVTAAIDSIRVRRPADVSRDLRFLARINYVGRSSMEIGIRVEQEEDHIASCYFTMVARDLSLEPLEVRDTLEVRRHERAIGRRKGWRELERSLLEPPTREEFEMLLRLHTEQEQPDFGGLRVRDLVASSWETVYPEQENVPKKIFGGYLIHRAFQLASIHAEQLVEGRAVVAAVNRINFKQPVRIGDNLRFVSRIVYTGKSSVAVDVKIERLSSHVKLGHFNYFAPDAAGVAPLVVAVAQLFGGHGYVASNTRDESDSIYLRNPGKPLSDRIDLPDGKGAYRVYENGLIAINTGKADVVIEYEHKKVLRDHFTGERVCGNTITLPASSGVPRAYFFDIDHTTPRALTC